MNVVALLSISWYWFIIKLDSLHLRVLGTPAGVLNEIIGLCDELFKFFKVAKNIKYSYKAVQCVAVVSNRLTYIQSMIISLDKDR